MRESFRRHLIRTSAILALYELDTTDHVIQDVLDTYLNLDPLSLDARTLGFMALCAFDAEEDFDEDHPYNNGSMTKSEIKMLHRLVKGVDEKRDELDGLITHYAPEWPAGQIAVIDRNVLRLAIFEIHYENVPIKVIINEAVEIAKVFGADSSPRFINGVLGAIARADDAENTVEDDEELQI